MTIRTKLLITFVGLSLVILLAAGIFSTVMLDGFFKERLTEELRDESFALEFALQQTGPLDAGAYDRLRTMMDSAGMRVTLIDSTGRVTFESERPESELSTIENHLRRPEVSGAFQHSFGVSTRHSTTIDADMMYYARKIVPAPGAPFGAPAIIRIGVPLSQVESVMSDIAGNILAASSVVLVLVLVVSLIIAHRVSTPLREMERIASRIQAGNLDLRLPVRSRDEIGHLCETLNQMIETLNEDLSKMRKLERFRSEFLGNVSHELRTPIFALQASLETLLDGAVHDPAVNLEFLDKALKNARRLDDLLSDLIEISRIESGDMKMSFRYFDGSEFVRLVAADVHTQAEKKSIAIRTEQSGTPSDVYGDKERIKQVMLNLLTNAIKYTEPGGTVTVRTEFGPKGVRLSVSDTGCGIPPEHLGRIFERFYRVDAGRSRDVGGTGLGLAIVKHIVEAHDSTVDVVSDVGRGSTFGFVLKTLQSDPRD